MLRVILGRVVVREKLRENLNQETDTIWNRTGIHVWKEELPQQSLEAEMAKKLNM